MRKILLNFCYYLRLEYAFLCLPHLLAFLWRKLNPKSLLVSRRLLLCIYFSFLPLIQNTFLKNLLIAIWLSVSMITCILLNFLTNFYSILVSFVIFLSCNVCANIIMAVAVNLYPTNYRAMAVAFIIMFGRIGSVSGSSLVGFLLSNNCTLIFYLFGGIQISECSIEMNLLNKLKHAVLYFCFRLCFGFHDD